MANFFTDTPVPYRTQNGSHYDGQQVLKPGLGDGETGLRIHLAQPGDPVEHLDMAEAQRSALVRA
jgi:NAD(P)H dehydrogenase (quinone)